MTRWSATTPTPPQLLRTRLRLALHSSGSNNLNQLVHHKRGRYCGQNMVIVLGHRGDIVGRRFDPQSPRSSNRPFRNSVAIATEPQVFFQVSAPPAWRRGRGLSPVRTRDRGSNREAGIRPTYWNCSWNSPEAGGGNRTLIISLEGWSSTIELHPRTAY